jgi:hypothetical protein
MASVVDVLSAASGLAVGAVLATVKYALAQRARLDEDLWSRRLDTYREVWALTSQFSRWPRQKPTSGDVVQLHEQFRRWYYGDGGILMSSRARKRYTHVQEGLAALSRLSSDTEKQVDGADYDDMVEILSGFRTALTEDLESRRKRSIVWAIVGLWADRKDRHDLNERVSRLSGLRR